MSSSTANRNRVRVLLARRPVGDPKTTDFTVEPDTDAAHDAAVPSGQVRLRTLYLSLDPYYRGLMGGATGYATKVAPGEVMQGEAVSVVEEVGDDAAQLSKGDIVVGFTGWRTHAVVPAAEVRRVPALPAGVPASLAVGVLGMPGITAYVGLLNIGKLRRDAGAVLVSTATGAVGAVVGQLAKLHGAKLVIGTASTDEKCRYAVEQLGYDICINYKRHAPTDASDSGLAAALTKAVAAAGLDGIELYYDNVGGSTLDAVLPLMQNEGTVVSCGFIEEYNKGSTAEHYGLRNVNSILYHRLRVRGFVIHDKHHAERSAVAVEALAKLVADGKLKYKEDVVDGLEKAPAAFLRFFTGENFGKLVVKVAE